MAKKINVIQTSLVLMAILVLLSASKSHSFFYRPATALSILSEYKARNDSAPSHTHVWKVVPTSTSDGGATLRFFLETSATADAVCELYFPPFGSAGEIRWKGIGESGAKESETGLLLAPGFPAPSDVLPIGETYEGRVYQEKSEAGGSMFIRRYLVSSAAISLAEAKAQGWIREEAQGISGLMMVTATDETGRLAVRQLWPAEGSWWLYEETPLRRSWRID